MRSKILLITVLFLFFLGFAYLNSYQRKPLKCKIIKVVEADEFYIDLNNNNTIDFDEHFKLKDVKERSK